LGIERQAEKVDTQTHQHKQTGLDGASCHLLLCGQSEGADTSESGQLDKQVTIENLQQDYISG